MIKFIETESKTASTQDLGDQGMRSCFTGIVSFLQDEKSSGERLPQNVNVLNTTEPYVSK